MLKSKREVDTHVRSSLSKLRSEKERYLRSFAISRLYYKIHEYTTAEQFLLQYISVKEDSDQPFKLLGQCYERMKEPEKALKAYQRSLQLNPKQKDVLVEVCKLLLAEKNFNSKAKYWCDLAESENVQDDAVFSLRLKLMNDGNLEANQVETLIQKEISARPDDVQLRVHLIRNYIDQNLIMDAFRYVYNLEMSQNDAFMNSGEWYNIVWMVLKKYEQLQNANKGWDFWLLLTICLERQTYISFSLSSSPMTSGVIETANLLFNLDQYLFKISQLSQKLSVQKEMVELFLNHYRGQVLLHAVSLILKRELLNNKSKWKEIVKTILPLLLFAYQIEPPESTEPWMKHCNEQDKSLIQLWNREGSFRCAQAGRTLLSCMYDSSHKENASRQSDNNSALWSNCDELLSQARQICSDKQWRKNIFALLFYNSDQKIKDQTSMLVQSPKVCEPNFELPTYADVERYEETARYLKPQSLQHMVYLCLGTDNLEHIRCKYFRGLNYSTQNLAFCGTESLNQLDVETFLYAAAIQAKRTLEVDRQALDGFNSSNHNAAGKPYIMPFVNLQSMMCTEEQMSWWTAAYRMYKNLGSNHFAELRAKLQYGIEAVRGINGPKMDMIIVFKLGKIFVTRSVDMTKPVEKAYLTARAENLYKYGLNMIKMHNKGVLEPFRKYFKYLKSNSTVVEREVFAAAEDAVSFLAEHYFKKAEYEELIEELSGIKLPFATYLQAEAYRKLDEISKTPKKTHRLYLDRASDLMNQTLQLLKNTQTDPNHPLNSIVHSEMKRLQTAYTKLTNENGFSPATQNNSSIYEDLEDEASGNITTTGMSAIHGRQRRDNLSGVYISSPYNEEMENLVKQMAKTLAFVKEEIVESIKPEVLSMRKEITSLKDKIEHLEDSMKKVRVSSNPPSRDEAANVLDDLYMIEDALQNQMYHHNQQTPVSTHSNLFPNASNSPSPFVAHQQQRVNNPNTAQMQHNAAVAAAAAYNSPMFNPNSMNYYTPPYMMAPQGPAGAMGMLGQQNPIPMPYVDSGGMNFNMLPGTSLLPQSNQDGRSRNLYGLLTQQPGAPNNIPQLSVPMPITQLGPPISSISTGISTPQTTPFNKVLNNQPVEKGPPANVVITTSDPLPNPNSVASQAQQPTLSVKIPSHHIKPSVVQTPDAITPPVHPPITSSPFVGFGLASSTTNNMFTAFSNTVSKAPTSTTVCPSDITVTSTPIATSTFSFKPQIEQAKQKSILNEENLNKTDDSFSSPNKSEVEIEYDPRPDFKPIIPLPDEVLVKTGEEDEEVVFCNRAKLYRHIDNEWKERGIGNIKILKNKEGYSRVLMRREQTHKICANHKITSDLKCTPAKNQTKAFIWVANDFADEEIKLETFLVRFKSPETAEEYNKAFTKAQKEATELDKKIVKVGPKVTIAEQLPTKPAKPFELAKSAVTNFATSTPSAKIDSSSVTVANTSTVSPSIFTTTATTTTSKSLFGGITTTTKPSPKPMEAINLSSKPEGTNQVASPFANFTFDKSNLGTTVGTTESKTGSPFANIFSNVGKSTPPFNLSGVSTASTFFTPPATSVATDSSINKSHASESEDDYTSTAQFNPVIPLPDLVEFSTGEENEIILFEHRGKLLRFDKAAGEWKERGLGNMKLLQDKDDANKVRLLMRREQVHKLCCNQRLYKDTSFKYAKNSKTAVSWAGQDFSENELITEMLTIRFKTADICKSFYDAVLKAQANMNEDALESAQQAEETKKETKSEKPKEESKGFGDAFKPTPGSWSCKDCYISNKTDTLYCVACDAPKDATVPKKTPVDVLATNTKSPFTFGFGGINTSSLATTDTTQSKPAFTFGMTAAGTQNPVATPIPTPAPVTATPNNTQSVGNGFGEKFKPKAGSWTCQGCYLSNSADTNYCQACDAPKDNTIPKKEPVNILAPSSNAPKFSFGFPSPEKAAEKHLVGGFVFGGPQATKAEPAKPLFGSLTNGATVGDVAKSFSFGAVTETTTTTTTTLGKNTFTFSLTPKPTETPAEPVAITASDSNTSFSLNKKDFCFTLKPKSPGKAGKSAPKLGGGDGSNAGDDADDGEYHEEEENNTYFTPVIPLPDKIDVKTGEENEELLYVHRAKLFQFTDGEWKERGVGDLKILRHKTTKKLRVIMRRDQVLKICLNHALNEDLEYKPKDEKSWLFVVNDFSEGQVEFKKFSLRFKTKEIAQGFLEAVKSALAGTAIPIEESQSVGDTQTTRTTIKNISDEVKKLADKLKLPYDFFALESNCSGCSGCDPDAFVFPDPSLVECFVNREDRENPLKPLEMPVLKLAKGNRSLLKQSALASAANSLTPSSVKNDPENLFSGLQLRSNFNENEKSSPTFSFSAAFNSTNKSDEQKSGSGGFLFGSGAVGSTTGGSIFSGDKTIFGQQTSIFGGKSTFGEPTLFGGSGAKTEVPKSIFGTNTSNITTSGGGTIFESKVDMDKSGNNDTNKQPLFGGVKMAESPAPPSFVELSNKSGGIDFASLAAKAKDTSTASFTQKPGPGGFIGLTNQDAFSSFSKASNDSKANVSFGTGNDSNANDSINQSKEEGTAANDENYDPHFEPIIALPNEIIVSTGEEEETKLFGERGTLYRFDAVNKEWKERGVGEIKILMHSTHHTYRVVMRREQIHKLVLNHAIGAEFQFKNMNNNPKSFVWAAMNYAESTEGQSEQLAVRFKKEDIAKEFSKKLKECIDASKDREKNESQA